MHVKANCQCAWQLNWRCWGCSFSGKTLKRLLWDWNSYKNSVFMQLWWKGEAVGPERAVQHRPVDRAQTPVFPWARVETGHTDVPWPWRGGGKLGPLLRRYILNGRRALVSWAIRLKSSPKSVLILLNLNAKWAFRSHLSSGCSARTPVSFILLFNLNLIKVIRLGSLVSLLLQEI